MRENEPEKAGTIIYISGPVVKGRGMADANVMELVYVSDERLFGEVIALEGDIATIQVYEETTGLKPGMPIYRTGQPLSVELGPGLIGQVFDGVQRPLEVIRSQQGTFIWRGVQTDAIDKTKKWAFVPRLEPGAQVEPGDIVGAVQETPLLEHRIVVPYGVRGRLVEVAPEGEYTVEEVVARIETDTGIHELTMLQRWPVRKAHPLRERLKPTVPLITGQRVIDILFPIAKGGTAAVPGGFGTGKCVAPGTPVLLADGTLRPIDEIYKACAHRGRRYDGGFESYTELAEPLRVFGFDGLRLREQPATLVYRGMTDRLIELRTRTGRRVRVTPAHRLPVLGPELEIREVAAGELRAGDYLVLPRKIDFEGEPQRLSAFALLGEERICDRELLERLPELIDEAARKVGTKRALAERLGVSYSSLVGYYHGRNRPTVGFLRSLAELLGLEEGLEPRWVKGERQSKPMRLPREVGPELAEFLGLVIGDGTLKPTAVCFYNNDERLLQRFAHLAEELFGLEAKMTAERTVRQACIHSAVLVRLLERLGIPREEKARRARVPEVIMRSPDRIAAHFLRAYFDCDGSFSRYEAELSTASERLQVELSYLLLRLGVLHSLPGEAGRYRIFIRGKAELARFFAACGRPSSPKFAAIRAYLEDGRRSYSGIDLVPAGAAFLEEAYAMAGRPHAALELVGVNTSNYFGGRAAPERMSASTFRRFAATLGLPELEGPLARLDHVFYDRIEEVRVIEGPSPVYDLTVPGTHNFVGGHGPLILHNTVLQHQLASWADADLIIFIGCGERGNEMTDVLTEFPKLEDPRTGRPLMERTILIANTSNMPVTARETSIYTGVTIAEYFRNMGYHVALMADSTSRWAEAVREIAGRLEEMPVEEGFPSYLAARLAEFYERAGYGKVSRDRYGSITIIGAVSPPGGDFTEPVTMNTKRFIRTFWALDKRLAFSRHFPAISWIDTYSEYVDEMAEWWQREKGVNWRELRQRALSILARENELQKIVQIIGPDALPDDQRLVLHVASLIKEGFLQQNAMDEIDRYSTPEKEIKMLQLLMRYEERARELVRKGLPIYRIQRMKVNLQLLTMKHEVPNDRLEELDRIEQEMEREFDQLEQELAVTAGVR